MAPIEKLNRSVLQTVLRSIYRPMLLLTLEPMCLNLCIFSALLLGILYLFFGAFQLVFSNVFGFSLWQVGCSFLGIFVGMVCAILSDPLWRRNYARLERKHAQAGGEKGEFEPEWRLPPGTCPCVFSSSIGVTGPSQSLTQVGIAIAGAPFVTVGLFIYAWTIYPTAHWIGPVIGSALFGAGYVPPH